MAKSIALALATCLVSPAWADSKGSMSMWSATHDTLVAYQSEGSACKYADREMGGLSAPTAQTPYIKARKYCAVNSGMFGAGEICGACYRLTYHGDHEQGLGRPGSEVIQVVDSGSWATFDCHMTAFNKINGQETGIFPITYERVACDISPGGPVAAVLHSDYYSTKLVFNNLHYPVKTAELTIGGKNYDLTFVGGWWLVWTGPATGSVSFKITEANGEEAKLDGCFGGWEHRKTGDACSSSRHSLLLQSSPDAANFVTEAADNSSSSSGNLRGSLKLNSTANVSELGNTSTGVEAALLYP